jgi:hypothetical protein
MATNTTEIKAQIALLKAQEKQMKMMEKVKAKNQAFQMRMVKEIEKNPANMVYWFWKMGGYIPLIDTPKAMITHIELRHYTISKLKKRNNPDTNNLLSLEQLHELAYLLDKPEWIAELTQKYNESNPFTKTDCCICMVSKCETELTKMRIKVFENWENSCNCNIDMCVDCITKINKCPTCRTGFTHFGWVK